MIIALVVLIAAIALYVLTIYNRLQTIKTRIGASIQEIGNQLKRQADLIPNLVESVKGYLKHEKGIFDQITKSREAILKAADGRDVQKMADAQDQFTQAFSGFRALVESTPELKGVEVVNQLMGELRDTSDKVMYSRRTLIDLTADYNLNLVTFPSNIVAKLFNFQPEKGLQTPVSGEHLEVSSEETVSPKVNL